MLPVFPNFKNIEISDKSDIESFTSRFAPYSDFNFISMWAWDIRGHMRVSVLHDNLVVKFTDYLTRQPFYSFLGDNLVNETAMELLKLSEKEGIQPILKLVPEVSAVGLDEEKFIYKEDRDHFDYIYDISKIRAYEGSKHKKHREVIRSFQRKFSHKVTELDLADTSNHKLLIDLLHLWIKNKKSRQGKNINLEDLEEFHNEYLALRKLLTAPADFLKSVVCFAVFVDDKLSGFMIDERVSGDYCISHFGKLDIAHSGNMQMLMQNSAMKFFDVGINYYNDEQDLGISHLRSSKSSYELAHHLKKYSVFLRD